MYPYLGISEVKKRLLIGLICLLQILHHQVAMTQTSPDFAIRLINLQHGIQVFDRSWEILFDS